MNTETITAGAKAPARMALKATTPALNVSDEFLADFCEKLNRPGLLTAIARADIGTSSFNRADNIEKLSPSILREKTRLKLNYAVINSIKPRPDLKRCGNSDIAARNWIIFDLDLKDQSDGFMALARAGKLDKVRAFFDGNKSKIEAILGPIWIAVYSGNGLHLYFHVPSLIDTSDIKKYECFYSSCLSKLKAATGFDFDEKFVSQSQMIRLPGSTNYKVVTDPLPTEVIYHDAKADSSQQLGQLFDDAVTALLAQKIVHLPQVPSQPQQRDPHTEAVRAALTFEKVLNHFGYNKWDLAQKNGTVISSPWRGDGDPSLVLNLEKKTFCDHGNRQYEGDIFDMIAQLWNIGTKAKAPGCWRPVMEIAEQITGIQKPEKPKEAKSGKVANTGDGKKPRAKSAEYNEFFYRHLPELSRELLSLHLVFKDMGNWTPAMNQVLALEALTIEEEMGLRTSDVKRFLSLLRNRLKPRLLLDLPEEWDGVDRIKTIAKCLHATNVNHEQIEELLKEFGAKMFERVDDPSVQNPMLIFTGGQGIGKSKLVKSMLGGLDHYFKSGRIGANDKDDDLRLTKTIAWCIDEYDQTKKADVARLKEMIFRESVTFRSPYAAMDETVPCRYSFMATANVTDLLRDPTGNRRYRIIDLEKIDWNYPTTESPQVLAQFKALRGYRISEETKRVIDAYTEEATPPTLEEQIISAFDDMMAGRIDLVLKGNETIQIRQDLHKMFKASDQAICKVLKESGRSSRKGAGSILKMFLPENNPFPAEFIY